MDWYPATNFYFKVTFSGFSAEDDTKFLEVSGLEKKMEYEPLEEGGSQRVFYIPTRVSYKNLILKRGIFKGSGLTEWCDNTFENYAIELQDIQISLLDEQGNPLASWAVANAYPVKWSMSPFNSMKNEFAVESLEIAYESFKRTV